MKEQQEMPGEEAFEYAIHMREMSFPIRVGSILDTIPKLDSRFGKNTGSLELLSFYEYLRNSLYDPDEKRCIYKENILAYKPGVIDNGSILCGEGSKNQNLIIYTLSSNGDVTRWGKYQGEALKQNMGTIAELEYMIPRLGKQGFTIIPPKPIDFL